MTVLPYLLSLNLDPNRFVQAINCSFTLSSLVMAAGLAQLGLLTVETAAISAFGLILVYLGIKLGSACAACCRRKSSVSSSCCS